MLIYHIIHGKFINWKYASVSAENQRAGGSIPRPRKEGHGVASQPNRLLKNSFVDAPK